MDFGFWLIFCDVPVSWKKLWKFSVKNIKDIFFKKSIFIVKMNFTLLKIYHSQSVQYLSFWQVMFEISSLIKNSFCISAWSLSVSNWAMWSLFHCSGLPSCSSIYFFLSLVLSCLLFVHSFVLCWSFVAYSNQSSHKDFWIYSRVHNILLFL